ncbi:TetR family transcriptional regulator [Bacillus sp. FJAT-27264]|uniref:TetR family transcriptional regulator n=1 Tax=Paenibacillus sp. (strain DSM 101736 / FJAT-27264) TaxID=1850362 RepID=UPI000807D9A6|nr:TetR family transcriptional regulator [Bacillus sp. FJAT-27264]OBZ18478.1 TetR family transcriptional regulator [Bacillus sp. FJAT-27264]
MTTADPDMKMRILLAAKKLFARQGYDGTSVRQICEEAGANVALVSYYFNGKENLLRAIFEQFFSGNRIKDSANLLSHPVEGLTLLIREIVLFGMEDSELSNIVKQEIELNSPRANIVLTYIHPVWEKVRELLERGRKEGFFHFDSLDHSLMFVIGAALSFKLHTAHSSLLQNTNYDAAVTADHIVNLVMASLRTTDISS